MKLLTSNVSNITQYSVSQKLFICKKFPFYLQTNKKLLEPGKFYNKSCMERLQFLYLKCKKIKSHHLSTNNISFFQI